jgi:uncharacterized membrane protein HdeD (DUF308 family)
MGLISKIKSNGTNWIIAILKGVMLIIFGIWLLKSPSVNISKLIIFFGVLIIIGGLFEVALAIKNVQEHKKYEWALASGIFDVLLGAFLVANPALILLFITIFVSIWFFIRGIISIRIALIQKKANDSKYNFSLFLGIILILSAVIFIFHPQVFGITVIFWTALSFISLGIFRIILAFKSI